MKKQINTIAFIGSGNVATRLSLALKNAGKTILQVYSRSEENAKSLAATLSCDYTNDLSGLNLSADLYIVCVSDGAFEEILPALKLEEQLVVHTSGTVAMEVLNGFENHGVFYPLQTFSKDKEVFFKTIPVFVESNKPEIVEKLRDLADEISESVHEINSEKRRVLHVAAVISNNFSNYLYLVAEDILRKNGLSLDYLKPLILETADKILSKDPYSAQTGPARRNDQQTIAKHLEILKDNPDYQQLYQFISEQIKRQYHSDD